MEDDMLYDLVALGPQWHLHIEMEDEDNRDDPVIEVPKEPGKAKSMQHLREFWLRNQFQYEKRKCLSSRKSKKRVAHSWKFNTSEFAKGYAIMSSQTPFIILRRSASIFLSISESCKMAKLVSQKIVQLVLSI